MDKFTLWNLSSASQSLHACVCECLYVLVPTKVTDGISFPEAESPYRRVGWNGCWEPSPGPLEEQPVLLTAEPSLQPPATHIFNPITWEVEAGGSIKF